MQVETSIRPRKYIRERFSPVYNFDLGISTPAIVSSLPIELTQWIFPVPE